jgi:tRNA-dihydrouridine synthase B
LILEWFIRIVVLMFLMGSLKIGSLKLKNPYILAPMVDVSDCAYRKICRESGASLAFTEMIYIDAILHENEKTKNLMKKYPNEKPVGLQITGNSIEEFERFVKSKKWRGFDLIDLNCGCPSLRITGNEAGSYLLNNPSKLGEIVRILKKTGKIITVKIRLGFRKNNVLKVAKEIERAGADALTVHGRLAVDGRDVKANWEWIKKVKESVAIPVIGNGDVFSYEDAERMMKETGCDGVMIARGAIGNSGVFRKAKGKIDGRKGDMLKSRSELRGSTKIKLGVSGAIDDGKINVGKDVNEGIAKGGRVVVGGGKGVGDVKKMLEMLRKYLKYQKEYYGKDVDIGRVKYVGGKFLRGFKGASKMREGFGKCKTLREMEKFVSEVESIF